MIDNIVKHFPKLTVKQKEQFRQLIPLYTDWNNKINVVSRKDIEEIEVRHILHSLSIAKYKRFKISSTVLDIGTGGGFPGIPLAVLYPKCNFHLVDSIGKKIKVVNEVAAGINLKNVLAEQKRVEDLKGSYKYIVSRAVAQTPKLLQWTKKISKKGSTEFFLLKGGDLTEELKPIGFKATQINISDYFKDEFFETKKIVWIKS